MSNGLLTFHIITGAIALLSGSVALAVRKGSRPHRRAGTIFVMSMLAMAATGAIIAYWQPLTLSVLGGFLTCYLVLTGWLTIKRAQGVVGNLEIVALAAALLITIGYFYVGMDTARSESGLRDGFAPGPFYFFGSVAALATVLDIRLLVRGGVSGVERIARHLWRMTS